GARRAVEQGHLAVEVTRAEDLEDLLAPVLGHLGDLHLPFLDDVHVVADRAVLVDHGVARKLPVYEQACDVGEIFLTEMAEQRNRTQSFVAVLHRWSPREISSAHKRSSRPRRASSSTTFRTSCARWLAQTRSASVVWITSRSFTPRSATLLSVELHTTLCC